MVGHHVAQGAGFFEKITPGFNADGFSGSNLHVIDVVVVPERFEQHVGETADQDVLHRLLAQVMVNAVDLLLAHHLEQAGVERLGGGQVGAERLLDNYAPKALVRFIQQTGTAQALHHFTEEARCSGEIEHRIGGAAVSDLAGDIGIGAVVEEIALDVADALGQLCPQRGVEGVLGIAPDFAGGFGTYEVLEFLGKVRIADGVVINADDTQAITEQPVTAEVVQRRHEQALDQVAMGAKQKQCGGWSRFGLGFLAVGGHFLEVSTWPPKPKRMADSILSP